MRWDLRSRSVSVISWQRGMKCTEQGLKDALRTDSLVGKVKTQPEVKGIVPVHVAPWWEGLLEGRPWAPQLSGFPPQAGRQGSHWALGPRPVCIQSCRLKGTWSSRGN